MRFRLSDEENQSAVIPAKAGIHCAFAQGQNGFRLSPERRAGDVSYPLAAR
jgi:hypothetical protein